MRTGKDEGKSDKKVHKLLIMVLGAVGVIKVESEIARNV